MQMEKALRNKRVLVTGGAGFIGSNLIESLLNYDNQVTCLDNFSTGKRENIKDSSSDIELVEGDLRDLQTVRNAVKGMHLILHQGALPSVPKSVADPLTTNAVNIAGTLNILVAARDEGISRVVYAASSSAYGDSPVLPKVETMSPNPLSPYAIQKHVGEQYCKVFYELYGLETVALRYFNAFGPRQDPASEYAAVIPRFITALAKGQSPTIYGDGEQTRDFTYVENVVRANLVAARRPGIGGEMMNIASGTRCSLKELLRVLQKIMQTDIEPIYADPRPGDVKDSLADIRKSQMLLGYTPNVPFDEGLRRTVESF